MNNVYLNIFKVARTGYEVQMVLRAIKRRQDLYGLIDWANRKQLAGPLKLYWCRAIDEEHRLVRYGARYPHLTKLAYRIHRLRTAFSLTPVYYVRGSASQYRPTTNRSNLTTSLI